MRRRDTDLHARVNGDLALAFDDVQLTSYAGLELFKRYLRGMRFHSMIRHAFREARPGGDFRVVSMVRLLIGLLVVGGRRLDHVAYVADDPLFRRPRRTSNSICLTPTTARLSTRRSPAISR